MVIFRSKFVVIKFEDKKVIVVEVNEVVKVVLFVVVVDVCGVIVGVMIGFCKEVCEVGVYVKVVCNILFKCVVEGIQFDVFNDVFKGLILIVFFNEYLGVVVCIFCEFVKGQDKFEIKVVVFEGQFFVVNQIDVLVSLLIYDEVVLQLMSVIQGVISKLVCILVVICDQKEVVVV